MRPYRPVVVVLSAITWLQVPDGIDAGSIGTVFRDPNAPFSRDLRPVDHTVVGAVAGHTVVFPGWLEHLPARPPPTTAFSGPRLGVVTNFMASPSS